MGGPEPEAADSAAGGGTSAPPQSPESPESSGAASAAVRAALIAETGRKSSVCWVRYPGSERSRPAWHGWVGDAVVLVAAGESGEQRSEEQQLPGLVAAEHAEVTMRAKDSRDRLLTWRASVRVLCPGSEEWDTACAVLGKERLNTTATVEQLPERWARTAAVIRLEPTGEVVEEPGSMRTESGAEVPPPSPATTVGRLPWVLGRRARRGRRLS